MTKTEKLKTLQTLFTDMVHINMENLKRKEIIAAALKNSLVEKDTYVALKPIAKSSKGYYVVAEMLKLVEAALDKGIPTVKVAKAKKPKKVAPVAAKSSPNAKETISASSGVYAYDALPYTQDDMAEELSLMGTYM